MLQRSSYLYLMIGVLQLAINIFSVSGTSFGEPTTKSPDPMAVERNQAVVGDQLTSNTNAGKMSAVGNNDRYFNVILKSHEYSTSDFNESSDTSLYSSESDTLSSSLYSFESSDSDPSSSADSDFSESSDLSNSYSETLSSESSDSDLSSSADSDSSESSDLRNSYSETLSSESSDSDLSSSADLLTVILVNVVI